MDYIINLSCPDRTGLVKAVAGWLFEQGCNILDSDQFRDGEANRFFMRVHFEGDVDGLSTSASARKSWQPSSTTTNAD